LCDRVAPRPRRSACVIENTYLQLLCDRVAPRPRRSACVIENTYLQLLCDRVAPRSRRSACVIENIYLQLVRDKFAKVSWWVIHTTPPRPPNSFPRSDRGAFSGVSFPQLQVRKSALDQVRITALCSLKESGLPVMESTGICASLKESCGIRWNPGPTEASCLAVYNTYYY